MASYHDIEELASNSTALQENTAKKLQAANDQLRLDTNKRFADMEQLTKAILFVAVISLVAVVVSVGALLFDQVRFNYEQSRQRSEESAKIEVLTDELKAQRDILQQKYSY